MAWVDKRLEFSDAQAVTADAVSTNVVDLSSDRDIGVGSPLWVIICVDVATDGTTGDETYEVELQTDDNSSFSSATEIGMVTIPRGTAAGSIFSIGFPVRNERYLRLNYDVGGTTPTGTFSAWLSKDPPRAWTAMPDAI
jgi:hypothetical protein